MQEIGNYAFHGNAITEIVIPNSVTSIGFFAFCANDLTSATLPDNLTTLGRYSFAKNELISITLPTGLEEIGESAFQLNEITNLVISNTVKKIGVHAFTYNKLTSISFPNSIERIEDYAFYNNNLNNISFGDNVDYIGKYAFYGNNVVGFTLPEGNDWEDDVGNVISGGTTVTDFSKLYTAIESQSYDINGDSAVDMLDIIVVEQNYNSSDSSCDINSDGIVNLFDLVLIANQVIVTYFYPLHVGRNGEFTLEAGATDVYLFIPPETRTYTVYSESYIDTVGVVLEGEDLKGSGDDEGDGLNFSINVDLIAGTEYFIGVSGYYTHTSSDYNIMIK